MSVFVQLSYDSGLEAVPESVNPCWDGPEASAEGQKVKQMMSRGGLGLSVCWLLY